MVEKHFFVMKSFILGVVYNFISTDYHTEDFLDSSAIENRSFATCLP
jgi:hypothetical protein